MGEMQHHAVVIEAETEAGIELALGIAERELGLTVQGNPDVVVLRHGLLSVEDARKLEELASVAPFKGDKRALIITADRLYHEAQNALLKLLEEPSPGTHLFLVVPTVGGLLPTIRSRVQIVKREGAAGEGADLAKEFIRGGKEERAKIIKALTSGSDDDDRRTKRDEAVALINGVERTAYGRGPARAARAELLKELATLRDYLYDRSSPVKLMLEHLALVVPRDLL